MANLELESSGIGQRTKVDEAKDELICSICTDFYNKPRSLKCLHSFCEECLLRLQKGSVTAKPDVLVCPECRTETELSPQGVTGLRKAFKLARLVEILTPDQKSEIRLSSVRKRSILSSPPMKCSVHASKPLEYYCEQCKVLICGNCMLKEHRAHGEFQCAEDALPMHIEALTGLVPYANEVGMKAANALTRLKEGTDLVRTQAESEVDNVRDYFTKLRRVLADREEELIDTIQRDVDEKVDKILKQRQLLQESIDSLRMAVQSIQHIAEKRSNDIEVLSEDAALKVRLLSHAEAIEIDSKAVTENWKPPTADSLVLGNTQLEKLLQAVGTKTQPSPSLPQRSHAFVQSLPYVRGSPALNTRFSLVRSDSNSTQYSEPYSPELPRVDSTISMVSTPPPTPPVRKESHQHTVEICEPEMIFSENNLTCSMFRNLSQNVLPCGVCVSTSNTILVTDTRNHCLRILTLTGKCLDVIGSEGKGEGQFTLPTAVTVDIEGNILVVDKDTPRVQKFTAAGKFLTKFSNRFLRGSQLDEPWGIAVSFDGRILVSDWGKSCIHIYDSSGRYQGNFGSSEANLQSALKYPAGIVIDQRGRVVVADRGNHCIWMYTPDGQLLGRFGQKGHAPGELFYPFGVAIDHDGNVIISESGNHRISIFSSLGKFKRCFGMKGTTPGHFQYPRHICIDSEGRLIVADELNERLQVFTIAD